MTLVSSLIKDSFRELNMIPIGVSPTTEQQTEALRRFNSYTGTLFGRKLGEFIHSWSVPPSRTSPVPSRYPLSPLNEDLPSDVWPYPPQNVRLLTKITSTTTVYLPAYPNDGARIAIADVGSTADLTLDGNGSKIESAASLTLTPATVSPRQWFYRADIAGWTRVYSYELTDESPLPSPDFDDLFICALAIMLAPRYGKRPDDTVLIRSAAMEKHVKRRYSQDMQYPKGWSPVMQSRQSYNQTYSGDLIDST